MENPKYWSTFPCVLESRTSPRNSRESSQRSHVAPLAVLVHEVTWSVQSTKVLATDKPPHVPERFADWNKLGSVTMMVDKKTTNLLKRERGEEDSKSTDEFLDPETTRTRKEKLRLRPRKKESWLTPSVLVSIPKGTNKRKRN